MPRLRPALVVLGLVLLPPVAAAGPRDDALRLAPPDAALLLVVQNAHDHLSALAASPFAEWLPTTGVGRQVLGPGGLGSARDALARVFRELKADVTPEAAFADVLGDAVVFAYTPAPADDPAGERAVILVRPRKAETLAALVERLNAAQTRSGEVTAVHRREHAGCPYYLREKAGGATECYGFVGEVFAFSTAEAEVRGVIDRARPGPPDRPAAWADRLGRLGVSDAAAVLAVNPRAFDADIRARAAAAPANERAFLARFGEVWAALDAAAVYLDLGRDLDLGVAVRFRPDALPPSLRAFITGRRSAAALWDAVPDRALAAAGRATAADLIDALGALAPQPGGNPVRAGIEAALGPVVGRDRLPALLTALGPEWAVWAEPPAAGAGPLPVLVAAAEVRPEGASAAVQLLYWAFLMGRVAYNANHEDQIELREETHGGVAIRTLVNDKGFPHGVRPSFALKGGFLLVSTSPDAIRRFSPPAGAPPADADVPLARVSAAALRGYLSEHDGPALAALLSGDGVGSEKEVRENLRRFAAVLELLDRADLLVRGDDGGLRLWVRVRFAKPLKK